MAGPIAAAGAVANPTKYAALSKDAMSELIADGLYYIQDKRQFCGNSVFWWKPNGDGYTCNLDEAWKVTGEKAKQMMRDRPDVDVAWPVTVIDAGSQRYFDMQYLRAR